MNRNNQGVLSLILILIGVTYMLNFWGMITLNSQKILAFAFMIYGIVTVYNTLGTHRKGRLFFGSALFLSGVVMFVLQYSRFLQFSMIIFPSLLFIVGAGFLMLFIDDMQNKVFLYSSTVLLCCGLAFLVFIRVIPIMNFANRIASGLFEYYPVFIILFGLYVLLNRKRL